MSKAALNPVTVINPEGRSDWLLVCEHASNQVPVELNQLGLPDSVLDDHMGYDIGASELTQRLAEQLDATAILCNYSRLVIDCNRPLSAPDCIPTVSDGVEIVGNISLSFEQKMWRIEQIYQPFHNCVASVLAEKLIKNHQTKLANIHSFTPMLAETGVKRPWEMGFVYRDIEPSKRLIDYLRAETSYTIGDNEPYNGVIHRGYTVPAHADAQEMLSFLVEFRQDLLTTPADILHWASVLRCAMAIV